MLSNVLGGLQLRSATFQLPQLDARDFSCAWLQSKSVAAHPSQPQISFEPMSSEEDGDSPSPENWSNYAGLDYGGTHESG